MKRKLQIFILSIIITITISDDCNIDSSKEELCSTLQPEEGYDLCAWVDNECLSIKEYSDCSQYTGGKKSICEGITLSNINYHCVLNGKECKKELYKCTDFTKKLDCHDITETTDSGEITHKCKFINNKCSEHSDECTGLSKDKCELNVPSKPAKKCVWKTKCEEEDRTCDDYIPGISSDCKDLKHSDNPDKGCIFDELNQKCKENFWNCGKGDSKSCSTILPADETTLVVKYNYKCEFKESTCKEVQKQCSEYIHEYSSLVAKVECESDFKTAGDETKKECRLINYKCYDEYKSCDIYNSITNKDGNTCKKIKLKNPLKKCDYSSDTCSETNRKCGDIKSMDSLEDVCLTKKPDFSKCVYSDGNCSEQKKTCLELSNSNKVKKDVCEAAITTDPTKKRCEIKSDNSGCQEVDKTQDNPNSSSNSNTESENQNGAKNINSKTIFSIICLLLL